MLGKTHVRDIPVVRLVPPLPAVLSVLCLFRGFTHQVRCPGTLVVSWKTYLTRRRRGSFPWLSQGVVVSVSPASPEVPWT